MDIAGGGVIAFSSPTLVYLDSCVVLSLFLGDSGYCAVEKWLMAQTDQPHWLSHWALLEFSGVVVLCLRQGELTLGKPSTSTLRYI